jgi:predicted O-methyltransferase YrrM
MLYPILSYLKFLLTSTNQHGIHSPFVFDFVTKCLYDTRKYAEYSHLNAYRNSLLKREETILITDFGTGSKVFKTNKRKVKDIAKHAGISKKKQHLLFRMAHYLNSKFSLELGTSLGLATIALAINKNNKVTTVEGCKNTAEVARKHLDAVGCTSVKIQVGDFEKVIKKFANTSFDLVYVDGNHNKESTLNYFELLLPFVHNETLFIFDDIYWSKGMTEAWKEIQNHPKVSVSIDAYYWGLVFFRKEQKKESFTVRL